MSTENKKSEQQLHYESLTSFLKYIVGIVGTLIVALASVAIYFSYGDRNSMRDEYEKTLTNVTNQIKDLKADAKETEKSIQEQSRYEVQTTKAYSEMEITRIKDETSLIATRETQKQIDAVFQTDKIQNIIENQAVKEIKSKVSLFVNNATENITKINDAASKMRLGHIDGIKILSSFFKNPRNSEDSLLAKNLYDQICLDYYDFMIPYSDNYYTQLNESFGVKPFTIVDNKMPIDSNQKKVILFLVNAINNKSHIGSLNDIAVDIILLKKYANKDFKPFDFDTVNKWFNGLEKVPASPPPAILQPIIKRKDGS